MIVDDKNLLDARTTYDEKSIVEKFKYKQAKSDNVLKSTKHYLGKNYAPNINCVKMFILNFLPIIDWMRNYNIRINLIKDVIGGLTIGIVQIPQSMAYSLMANLPPVNGLYVSFFTTILYFFFGTCRHLSIGTYGVVSLMVSSSIERLDGKLYPSEEFNSSTTNFISEDPIEAKIMIAGTLAFLVGIIHIVMGIIHGGVVTKYLSDTIVAGFTTGAAYHIVVSQLNSLLGIPASHDYSLFKIVEPLIELFSEIEKTNYRTVIVSIVSMIILYLVKHFINERYKQKLIAPIPIELFIIILGTVLSYVFNFNKKFGIKIVGDIPLGIPVPKLPPVKIINYVFVDAIEIAIVSFALNISMAKLFAKRYHYSIRPNQELFVYGLGNFITSFFRGFPLCVGLSRCVILEGTGAKTLLHSAITSILVLIVIVAIGFLFESLPIACLAAIIVVALIPMLLQVRQIVTIYKKSKIEALAWLATFLGVMILDVDYGLYIGLVFSLFLYIIQNQRPSTYVLGNIPRTEIYEAINICEDALEIDGIKIIRYESSLFYANVDNFIYKVKKLSGINPDQVVTQINARKKIFSKNAAKKNPNKKKSFSDVVAPRKDSDLPLSYIKKNSITHKTKYADTKLDKDMEKILEHVDIQDIILDFSCVNLIDSMGIDAIIQLNDLFQTIGVQLHLSYCKRYVIRIFDKYSLKDKFNYESFLYPTTHDGVLKILKSKKIISAGTRSLSLAKRSITFQMEAIAEAAEEKRKRITYEKLDEENENLDEVDVYANRKTDVDDMFEELVLRL